MRVLAVVHGPSAGPGVFADAVLGAGHELERWSPPLGGRPPADRDAVLVLGGAMHPDEDAKHPWLTAELRFLEKLLEDGTPVLGVCLGAQLLARAAGSSVHPAPEPEAGWFPVERIADDPVLGALPRRFDAFLLHSYTYVVPDGATELARSERSTQAFRLGAALGIQFHAEITADMISTWLDEGADELVERAPLLRETDVRISGWNELGRSLCGRFLAAL